MPVTNTIAATQPAYSEKSSLAWIVCLTAGLFFFYEFIETNLFSSINAALMQAFHLTATQMGSLSAAYFYANILFLFPAGTILDRYSTRKVILLMMGICVAGTTGLALSQQLWQVAVCRFATGIGGAFCFVSSLRLASRWFPANRMALVSALILTLAMTGGMVSQTPVTLLTQAFGWRHALLIVAAFGVIIMLFIWRLVIDYPPGQAEQYQANRRQLQQLGVWKSLRLGVLNWQNWLAAIYTGLMNLPLALLGSLWGILYLVQVHHISQVRASYITTMLFVGAIMGSPLIGWASDRLGRRKPLMILGAIIVLPLAILLLLPIHLSMGVLFIVFLLLGFITSTQAIAYPTVAENNSRLITAISVSVISTCAMLGYAIFQPVFGQLMDWHWNGLRVQGTPIYSLSDYQLALMILPVGFILALLAASLIRETYCRSREETHG